MDVGFLVDTLSQLMRGVPLTLELAAISVSAGSVLALALALALETRRPYIVWPIRGYVAAFRGTPLLVRSSSSTMGLGSFASPCSARPLGLFPRALLVRHSRADAQHRRLRHGDHSRRAPSGPARTNRGRARLRHVALLAYRRVILPIALRQALPSYGNEIILMIKGTSLTSIVTLLEITGIAQQIISQTYRAVEVFACAGALYLAMNYLVAHLVATLEHRLSPH